MNQFDYTPIGGPRKQRARGKSSKKWYQRYRLSTDPTRKIRSAPCSVDLGISKRKRDHYIEEHIKSQQNIVPSGTMTDLVEVWRQDMEGQTLDNEHIQHQTYRVKAIIDGCKFITHHDITELKIRNWLSGRVKAKQFGQRTANYYLKAMKTFTKFMAYHKQIPVDPLAFTSTKLKGEIANTRPRRPATITELQALLKATKASKPAKGLTGQQRAALYCLAANTGLRCQELASLTPESFDLSNDQLTVHCTISKRRRTDHLALSPDVVAYVRPIIEMAKPKERVFPRCWYRKAGKMLAADLALAGIKAKDAQGRILDFHALRHTFVTNVANTGIAMSHVQEICRLSTPALVERYFHSAKEEHRAVIASLPTANLE